jgi:hypothetical protein
MPSKRVSLKGKGADLFFGDYTPPVQSPSATSEGGADEAAVPVEIAAATPVPPEEPSKPPTPVTLTPSKRSPRQSVRRQQTTPTPAAGNGASQLASTLAIDSGDSIRAIRKVVRMPGKEVSFVRLTPEEKAQVADIVYTYKRQGQKTTENEINRIALNHLLLDYHENGEHSVLARVLAALRD